MILPNKNPDEEKKLVFKETDYITALYCILEVVGGAVIKADAFKNLSNCKDKIIVEYNADEDTYRLKLRKKRKRGVITPRKRIIMP